MEKHDLQIGEIRLLHLSRSAPSLLTPPRVVSQDASEAVCFSLFDYFDWLVVRKGDTLDYKTCFGLEQTESISPLITSEYLTLVSLAGKEKVLETRSTCREGDPFFSENDPELSKLPFLSVMMVNVLPDPIVAEKTKKRGILVRPADVEHFLTVCTTELQNVVREVCQEVYAAPTELQVVFQVYNCINSGNFCVVMRSRAPELTYHVSMRVRAGTLYQTGDPCFPALDCSTYSLVGLSCPVDWAAQKQLTDVIARSKAEVALRLSVTNGVRNQLFQYATDCMSEDLRGLYGRYDVTLRLSLEQFGMLYPWICAHKLGLLFPVDDGKPAEEIIHLLRQSLSNQGAQCINSRLLLHMEGTLAQENSGKRRKKRQEEVRRENEKINRLLQEVKQSGNDLAYCQEEYRTCLSLLEDLWESYSSLRYQDDSFIDGNILLVQVNLLLNIVSRYLESIQKDCNRKSDYETLSKSLRVAINSIDHFQKLMLSINQQSMQAPNYEVQMHADLEKFVVAYTEFSRRFLSEHVLPAPFEREPLPEKPRQLIFPIITVNTTLDAIRALPLFLLPYCGKDGLLWSNRRQESLLLSIEIPENKLLGDVYAILPLICHELFHNFRILDRKERNNDLAKYLFHRIAQFIVRRWIAQAGEKDIYHAFGRLEDELYIDELAILLNEAYLKRCGKAHDTANIGVLINNIRLFLAEEVFTQREVNQLQRPELTLEQVKEQFEWLCRLALEAAGIESPDWRKDYQICRDLLAEVTDEDEEGWKELAKQLVPLAGRLGQAVVDGHLERVRQAGEALRGELDGDTKSEAEGLLERIYEKDRPRKLVTGSASEIDQWIGEISAAQRVVGSLSSKSNRSKALTRATRMLNHAVFDMCRSVKDANLLYLLLGSWDRYQNRPYNRKVRDQLVQDYHGRILGKVDQYYEDRELFWLLHSSPSLHELTAPLGGDLDEEAMFAQMLKQVLLSTAQRDISSLIDSSATLYREVFADLGMCVSLDLDSFGYLNVLAHNSTFQTLDSQSANIRLERMRIVCMALFSEKAWEKGDALVHLQSSGQICLDQLADRLERDMTAEGRCAVGWRLLRAWIEELLKGEKEIRSVPAFRLPVKTFCSWFDSSRISGDAMYDMYSQFKALWILAHLINHLSKTVKSGMGHPLQHHFSDLLPVIRSRWQRDEAKSSGSGVVKKVGEAYSNPAGIEVFLNPGKRFKDTLSFVMYYYYHGWNVYGWSDRSESGAWLNELLGGAPL